jgi:hypothetical protein
MSNFFDAELQFSETVGGYNLTYLKPGAATLVQTSDENNAPLLATWQNGLGRVACYMGTTAGETALPFIGQKAAADLFAGLCSWVTADKRQFIDNMPVTQQLVKGRWQATLHLDPEREREMFKENPEITVLRSSGGKAPDRIRLKMNWETADTLSASLQLSGNDAIVALIDAGENRKLKLYPVCLPYSQEFSLLDANEGSDKLKEIAMISNGRELINLNGVWENMPDTVQYQSIAELLLFIALVLFVLEVAERRTAVLTILYERLVRMIQRKPTEKQTLQAVMSSAEKGVKLVSRLDEPEKEVEKSIVEPEEEGFSQALRKAKTKADKRTQK